jgi:hypothetical protein
MTSFGLRAALFCTRSYSRILRPGRASVVPGDHAIHTPLQRCFDAIEKELTAGVQKANLAA